MIPIYTAICGKYPYTRTDIKCFGTENIFQNPVMEAKRYKILPHLFFDDPITIWIDGNITLLIPPEEAVRKYLGRADIAIFRHPIRDCLFDEINALQRDTGRFAIRWLKKSLAEQFKKYWDDEFPIHYGLWECNFIIRRNNERVNNLMNAWWAEICRWQWRDQVSFPYVLSKYGAGVKLATVKTADIRNNENFLYRYHS